MSDVEKTADPHFQEILKQSGLPPDTTKGQFMAFALKRALKRAAWSALIFAAIAVVLLWHYAPDMLFQILGVPYVVLSVAAPFLMIVGFFYIGYRVVKL